MLGAPHRAAMTNGPPCAPTRQPRRARIPEKSGQRGGHVRSKWSWEARKRPDPRSARTALDPHRLWSTSFVKSAEIRADVDALLAHRSFTASTCAAQQGGQRSGESLGGRRAPRSAVEGRRSARAGGWRTDSRGGSIARDWGGVAQGPPRVGLQLRDLAWLAGARFPITGHTIFPVPQSGGKHLESRGHHGGQSGEKPGKEQREVRWRG